MQLGLATSNFAIQEFMQYVPLVDEVFHPTYHYEDGYVHPGDVPGLGVDFDEAAAARFPYERAYLPIARDRDGSMRDW